MDQLGPKLKSQINLVLLEADMPTHVDYTSFIQFLIASGFELVDSVNDCDRYRTGTDKGYPCDREIQHLAFRRLQKSPTNGTHWTSKLQGWNAALEAHLSKRGFGKIGWNVNEAGKEAQQAQYDAWAQDGALGTVCEVGFGAGHSALRFLAQGAARVYEFDSGQHPYSRVAA